MAAPTPLPSESLTVSPVPALNVAALPAPSTPLGPISDGVVAWTTWITLMGFLGVATLALVVAGPVARRIGPATVQSTTVRLARVATVLGILVVPAVLSDEANGAAADGGYDYGAAWDSLYDGTVGGRILGLEVTFALVGLVLVAPLVLRRVPATAVRRVLLTGGVTAGAVALAMTRWPTATPFVKTTKGFQTLMWMLHLLGGAVWIGGLIGLLALALPGAVARDDRGAFWSPAIRRFSVAAMSSVGAITLSGLFLYWEHVDGPSQLFTTMYGRVLGVKILIAAALLLLGMVNQFWMHPRIDALRAAGDERPLRTILARQFPAVIALEVILGLAVLLVAPFLGGSARNQAFQADAAAHASSATKKLPRIAPKSASASTWLWGTAETVAVIVVMVGGYQASGRIARRRIESATATRRPEASVSA
jgi:putative copper export protein